MLPVLAGFIAMASVTDRHLQLVCRRYDGSKRKIRFPWSTWLQVLLAGYLILGLRKVCDKLPEALEKIAPVLIYPVVGILAYGTLMTFIVEPIMGGINTGLNNGLDRHGKFK